MVDRIRKAINGDLKLLYLNIDSENVFSNQLKIKNMAWKATFTLGGTDYQVLSCGYGFNQEISHDGRPSSGVHGGRIHLTIPSSDDTSLVEWMADPNKVQDGSITFYQQDSEQVLKELDFTNGYCVSHHESFSNTGSNPMVESIVISAQSITIGNAVHDNAWPSTS